MHYLIKHVSFYLIQEKCGGCIELEVPYATLHTCERLETGQVIYVSGTAKREGDYCSLLLFSSLCDYDNIYECVCLILASIMYKDLFNPFTFCSQQVWPKRRIFRYKWKRNKMKQYHCCFMVSIIFKYWTNMCVCVCVCVCIYIYIYMNQHCLWY